MMAEAGDILLNLSFDYPPETATARRQNELWRLCLYSKAKRRRLTRRCRSHLSSIRLSWRAKDIMSAYL